MFLPHFYLYRFYEVSISFMVTKWSLMYPASTDKMSNFLIFLPHTQKQFYKAPIEINFEGGKMLIPNGQNEQLQHISFPPNFSPKDRLNNLSIICL